MAVASPEHIWYGGYDGFFQDKPGQRCATVWSIPDLDHLITIPRIEMTPHGIVRPMLEDWQDLVAVEPR